jgi:hypothetical protein
MRSAFQDKKRLSQDLVHSQDGKGSVIWVFDFQQDHSSLGRVSGQPVCGDSNASRIGPAAVGLVGRLPLGDAGLHIRILPFAERESRHLQQFFGFL